jgi:hypothetical protein
MGYILTAWSDDAEMTLRTHEPAVVLKKAAELVADGWRVSFVRTDTCEVITVSELQEIERCSRTPERSRADTIAAKIGANSDRVD